MEGFAILNKVVCIQLEDYEEGSHTYVCEECQRQAEQVVQSPRERVFLGSGQVGVSTGQKSRGNKGTSECARLLISVLYFIALTRNSRTLFLKDENRYSYFVIIFNRNSLCFYINH